MRVGKADTFERRYTAKFRLLASNFGEFVFYERDRGARDIGLHLTRKRISGSEEVSTTLCWFQLKGLMSSTFSDRDFAKASVIKLRLEVSHLKYWFLQPMPTYLVVYIESVDTFLVLDIQEYVNKKWSKSILNLSQKTKTVEVPKASVLDEQAFSIILRKGDIDQWIKVLEITSDQANLCLRDYQLIFSIGTSEKRGFEQRLRFWDWLTKMRSQMYFEERKKGSADKWTIIREYWQSKDFSDEPEDMFPYLSFFPISPTTRLTTEDENEDWDEVGYYPENRLILKNGEIFCGTTMLGFEFVEYILGYELNQLGRQMFDWIKWMIKTGLLEIDSREPSMISVAPWHHRAV